MLRGVNRAFQGESLGLRQVEWDGLLLDRYLSIYQSRLLRVEGGTCFMRSSRERKIA